MTKKAAGGLKQWCSLFKVSSHLHCSCSNAPPPSLAQNSHELSKPDTPTVRMNSCWQPFRSFSNQSRILDSMQILKKSRKVSTTFPFHLFPSIHHGSTCCSHLCPFLFYWSQHVIFPTIHFGCNVPRFKLDKFTNNTDRPLVQCCNMTIVCCVRELLLSTLLQVVGWLVVVWLVVCFVGWLVVDRFVKIRVSAVSSDQVSILPPTNSCSLPQARKSFLLVAISSLMSNLNSTYSALTKPRLTP